MRYSVTGPATIIRDHHGTVTNKQSELWDELDAQREGVSDGCGCYVFAVRAGTGMTPWYVGKTEKQSFRKECFTPHKIAIYLAVMNRYKAGTPILFLLPRETPGGKLCKTSTSGYRDVAFLETMLISQALQANSDLSNVKDTKMLKDLVVPGLINGKKGKPTASTTELKRLLNLHQKSAK